MKFCTAPGVVNADMVIVLSENIKKMYLDTLINTFGVSTKKDWENKIFSMRSHELKMYEKVKETGMN